MPAPTRPVWMPPGGKLQPEPCKVASTTIETTGQIGQRSTVGRCHRAPAGRAGAQLGRCPDIVAALTGVLDVSPRKQLSRRRLSCPILDLSAEPGCERGLRPCDTVETKSTAEATSSMHQEASLRSACGACPRFAAAAPQHGCWLAMIKVPIPGRR